MENKESNRDIIVVGNGSTVLRHYLGSEIDSFKEVVRINNFVTKGYEKNVGSKTTIWARSNSKRTIDRRWEDFSRVIIASPVWNFGNIKDIVKERKCDIVPREKSLELQLEMGLPGRANGKKGRTLRGWPSTGLLILNYLLTEYSTIHIHGFDCFNPVKGNRARHYYNNMERMVTTGVHDSKKEKEWINKKIKERKIRRIV